MITVSEKTKKHIESMTDEEIEFEINLGRQSHFQRESFAWLQTVKSQRDKLAQKLRNEENDAMMRAFQKVPLANELEGMSEIELVELQSQLTPDSHVKIIIENEWKRRRSKEVPNLPINQTNNEYNWQSKILIYIAVGVVIVILGTFAIHLIKKLFGIPL